MDVMTLQQALQPLHAELFICLSALILLLAGVWRGDKSALDVTGLSTIVLVLAACVTYQNLDVTPTVVMSGMLLVNPFTAFMKLLVLVSSALVLVLVIGEMKIDKQPRFEFPILVLLSVLGMMLMISANNLIALYMGIELMSLALYVLAAFNRDNLRSSEAGLKYFVLGAIASGMLLYGASLIYGFTGTTDFAALAALFGKAAMIPVGVTIGLVMIIIGLCFKVSAVPFHMWTPDVYEGAPTPVTAFFAAAPKIAGMALFMRVLLEPFGHLGAQWQQVIIFVSVASMLLGAFAALRQTNIKRLLAYSSIGHVGYALLGLAAMNAEGVQGIIIYLALYLLMSIGAFGVVLLMRRRGKPVEEIVDLAGLSRTHPKLALAMAIFMFSMAGIPPMAGFFGKFYVFTAAVQAHLYVPAVIGLLASVVAAYYYLRVVKLMYLDEATAPLDKEIGMEATLVLTLASVVTGLFFLYPTFLITMADAAAAALPF